MSKSTVCNKLSSTAVELARHTVGQGDRVHREETDARGLRFSESLTMHIRSYGGEGYTALAEVLDKDTEIRD